MKTILLGERIAYLMELQGTNQKQVCKALHIQPSTFSCYLSGKRQPSYDILIQIAAYFGTSCDYLLGYSPTATPSPQQLSDKESALVDTYRVLDEEGREIMLEEVRLVCKHYKKDRSDT